MDDNPGNLKQQIAQRIKEANNVLVTVSNNPSVDQLASAIGLTLLLNKMGKHGTAVFSGQVPSTIEFLEPEKTLEKNTDSLRDFIIALDKSKADKLRYKVEDKLVKIFITPYRTSLSDKDLEFTQGDFNVDVVIALGVKKREQLDQAIMAHGRILHDATVISINTDNNVDLGTMNLVDNKASSLCEIVASLVTLMQSDILLDGQMATAFLTGIVAATDRFRNNKTSPATMSVSSRLMTAGANQQLIASKLEEAQKAAQPPPVVPSVAQKVKPTAPPNDGALLIDHQPNGQTVVQADLNIKEQEQHEDAIDQIDIDAQGTLIPAGEQQNTNKILGGTSGNPKLVVNPPSLGGTLTANSRPEGLDPSTDPMTLSPVNGPLLSHDVPPDGTAAVANPLFVTPPNASTRPQSLIREAPQKPANTSGVQEKIAQDKNPHTLAQLEQFLDSPHVHPLPAATTESKPPIDNSPIDAARNAVDQAVASAVQPPLEPIAALNANPLNLDLGHGPPGQLPSSAVVSNVSQNPGGGVNMPKFDMPANLMPTSMPTDNTAAPGQAAPPPVPPPMMPPVFNTPSPGQNPPQQPV